MRGWKRKENKKANYLLEVQLCLEEMGQDLLGVQVREEVWAEAEEVLGGWEVTALELALEVSVFALVVELGCPTR